MGIFTRTLIIVAVLVAPGLCAYADSDETLAIVGINVIPMDEARVMQDQTVLIREGNITSLGARASVEIPANSVIVDGTDQYLMPGFADLHVHIATEDDFINYLAWGVTTVMHLGGSGLPGADLLEHRKEINDGKRIGPVLYTTNRMLDGDPPLSGRSLALATPDAAHKAVRDLKTDGFDFIKIYNNVSLPVFEAIVAEARIQELAVIGHIPRGFDTLIALRGGQNAVAHTEEFFFAYFDGPRDTSEMQSEYTPDMDKLAPAIDSMLENQVAVMPDLAFTFTDALMWDDLDLIWSDPEMRVLHPSVAEMWQGGSINRRSNIENFVIREEWKYDLMQRLTIEFQKAGILQVVGTDAGVPGLFPGKALHRELTELVKAGLSNFDTMAIATRNAGEFLRRYIDPDFRQGLVKPGYRANLVLLQENPLEDVRNARTVQGVVVNGRWTPSSELQKHRDALAERYAMLNVIRESIADATSTPEFEETVRSIVANSREDAEIVGMVEAQLNRAGYRQASAENLELAARILKLNTELFPNSANTWDSYAEVTLMSGDREKAVRLYEQALVADPGFVSAQNQLERLRKQN